MQARTEVTVTFGSDCHLSKKRGGSGRIPPTYQFPTKSYNTSMIESRTLDGLIIKDPQMHNGRPTIAGTGHTVRAIAIMYKQGLTPEEITIELPLSLAQVYVALTYYHLNTDEIEADIRRDSEAALKEQYGNSING